MNFFIKKATGITNINVALSKYNTSCAASHEAADAKCTGLFDDHNNTGWISERGIGSWVTVKLPHAYNISKIELKQLNTIPMLEKVEIDLGNKITLTVCMFYVFEKKPQLHY